MWEAKPLIHFNWLTTADLVVLLLGCIITLLVCFYLDLRDRRKQKRLQDQLHRSVLDAKSRVLRF